MILFKKAKHISECFSRKRSDPITIGFVPTMGALHSGHLSLIKRSKQENSLTVCSIFVNPAQFNDPTDLEKYPRPIERDIEMLTEANCNVLFLPDEKEIYPEGMRQLKNYDLGHLENFLEGASRPGHFKGVANVVYRLLQIVKPDRLYLGQKDFQQVKVIQKLLQATQQKVQLIMCPIMREEDGLAMSSRNVRLTPAQRKHASGISRELFFIQDHHNEYSMNDLKREAISRINSIPEAQVDYLEFCDADSFQIIYNWSDAKQIAVVTAVRLGNVRLLDNVLLNSN